MTGHVTTARQNKRDQVNKNEGTCVRAGPPGCRQETKSGIQEVYWGAPAKDKEGTQHRTGRASDWETSHTCPTTCPELQSKSCTPEASHGRHHWPGPSTPSGPPLSGSPRRNMALDQTHSRSQSTAAGGHAAAALLTAETQALSGREVWVTHSTLSHKDTEHLTT